MIAIVFIDNELLTYILHIIKQHPSNAYMWTLLPRHPPCSGNPAHTSVEVVAKCPMFETSVGNEKTTIILDLQKAQYVRVIRLDYFK